MHRGSILTVTLWAAGALISSCAGGPELVWEKSKLAAGSDERVLDATRYRVVAGPLSSAEMFTPEDAWRGLLVVRILPEGASSAEDAELPSLAGAYRVEGPDRLVFEPAYPLEPGLRYVARFRPGSDDAISLEISLPRPERSPSTRVEAVYPSVDVLPENLLKFYLVFSAPMSRGQVWDRIRLIDDESGAAVEMPFLELDEELWDPSGTRLTVLIDPGRIKRGVLPHDELGPALIAGGSYTLEIDSAWEDANGVPLVERHLAKFRVGPPDYEIPAPENWNIDVPAVGGREALVVRFDEPLDHGLVRSAIAVEIDGSELLDGEVSVDANDSVWRFVPAAPWKRSAHALVVATTLEDLAGNSVARPFEVDATSTVGTRIEIDLARIPFEPLAE
jgi:hypothetical protein